MKKRQDAMHRSTPFLLSICAVTFVAIIGAQQTRDNAAAPTAGTAIISGAIVIDDQTGQPVRHATVTLGSLDFTANRVSVTDDAGRFAFVNVPAGRYQLSASKPGMIATAYGAKRPGGSGSTIPIADGQHMTGIAMKMMHGAVITGTVRDATGQPVADASVSVLQYRPGYQTGVRTLTSVGGPFGDRTDDRGVYRTFNLPPGDYLVVVTLGIGAGRGREDLHQVSAAEVQWATRQVQSPGPLDAAAGGASPAPGANVTYTPMFYPGTPMEASAATITLAAGEERSGVDIPWLMVQTDKLHGTIAMADGSPLPNVEVNLVAQDRIESLSFAGMTGAPAVKDGAFTITGLAPGQYTVTAHATSAAALYAISEVTVSGEDATVALTLRSGVTVSGRLAFEGTTLKPPADLTKARVSMNAVVSGKSAAIGVSAPTVNATGDFQFTGVAPGRYRITATIPGSTATSGWQPKTAMVEGHDAFDVPFEVRSENVDGVILTFTDRPTEVSGSMQDAAGRPAPEYWVILFPADRTFWTPQSRRIQAKRPGSDGRFSFPNMPPGDYLLGAVTDVERFQWFDPAFLAQLAPVAVKIPLGEGEKKVQDIKIGG